MEPLDPEPAAGAAAPEEGEAPGYTWDEDDRATAPHRPRWVLVALLAPIVGLIVANNVGAIMLTNALAESAKGTLSNPLEILALNSTNKILLATGFQTDPIGWYLVATLRLLVADPLFYLLGYLYRTPALSFGRGMYPGADRIFDLFEHEDHKGVHRMLDVLVFVMPNNPVCLLAGVAAMPVGRFLVVNLAGTLARLVLFRILSFSFQDEIKDFMDFLAGYQKWALIATVVIVVISLLVQARRLVSSADVLDD